MKIYESKIFGNIAKPTSVDGLFKLVLGSSDDDYQEVYMWRGQSDISWPVHSTAYRRLLTDKEVPMETDIAMYEERLLKQARHKGFHEIGGRVLNDFDLLARLQHHGAATRLVDATRNVLVALYFAVSGSPTKTGVLLGWHAHYLGGYEGETKEDTYEEATKVLEKFKHPQTWEPPVVTPRISAQRSQFLYSSVSSAKTGSLYVSSDTGSLLAVAITPSLKLKVKMSLASVFDIRHLTLFPDIDGFCKANSVEVGEWENYRW